MTIFSAPGMEGETIVTRTKLVLKDIGIPADVRLDTNEFDFASAGVMFTPAISINGKLISNGWVPEAEELKSVLMDSSCRGTEYRY